MNNDPFLFINGVGDVVSQYRLYGVGNGGKCVGFGVDYRRSNRRGGTRVRRVVVAHGGDGGTQLVDLFFHFEDEIEQFAFIAERH